MEFYPQSVTPASFSGQKWSLSGLAVCVSVFVGGMLEDDNDGCNGCYEYLCLAELWERTLRIITKQLLTTPLNIV